MILTASTSELDQWLTTAGGRSEGGVSVLAVARGRPLFALEHPNEDLAYVAEVSGLIRLIDRAGNTVQVVCTEGEAPCHLVIGPTGRHLYCANYTGSSLVVFELADSGRVVRRLQLVKLPTGLVDVRPSRPHHILFPPESASEVLVTDLGQDRILRYTVDSNGTLMDPTEVWRDTSRSSGPRSVAIDRFGHLWCSDERASAISRLVGTGGVQAPWSSLKRTHTWPASKGIDSGPNFPGALVPSADGSYLYLANRGMDTIAVFCAGDTILGPVQEIPCVGGWPSSIEVVDDVLFVACQKPSIVTAHAIDPRVGTLSAARPVRYR